MLLTPRAVLLLLHRAGKAWSQCMARTRHGCAHPLMESFLEGSALLRAYMRFSAQQLPHIPTRARLALQKLVCGDTVFLAHMPPAAVVSGIKPAYLNAVAKYPISTQSLLMI